jgi:hypothetical protein
MPEVIFIYTTGKCRNAESVLELLFFEKLC